MRIFRKASVEEGEEKIKFSKFREKDRRGKIGLYAREVSNTWLCNMVAE